MVGGSEYRNHHRQKPRFYGNAILWNQFDEQPIRQGVRSPLYSQGEIGECPFCYRFCRFLVPLVDYPRREWRSYRTETGFGHVPVMQRTF